MAPRILLFLALSLLLAAEEAVIVGFNSPSRLYCNGSDPCKWKNVPCSDNRVVRIQIGRQNLGGFLPCNINIVAILGFVIVVLCAVIGALVFFLLRAKVQPSSRITIAGSSFDGEGLEGFSVRVLKNATDILGRAGFGSVYEGELNDGTKVAVEKIELGNMSGKDLDEFESQISALAKVRHINLVKLFGYCISGSQRLLVFELMTQGTLSKFLFNWNEEGLKPLEWRKRLGIALDVARGVEYLHCFAEQSFIIRDLKPSNILLGDDMRAKVADFGLVRHTSKFVGTFGYLAPEYAETGRASTKMDVYSFGVVLMELITGRKALDKSLPKEKQHLVAWFPSMLISKGTDAFSKAIDPNLDITEEETLLSIITVAELAAYCSAREPNLRPSLSLVVHVLSSLAGVWMPTERADPQGSVGIKRRMTLAQMIKKWKVAERMSSLQ